ncbi:MAG TPA: lipopolysaccharide transport periplasmic protein LptA [Rhodanobacteraceae bacterium]
MIFTARSSRARTTECALAMLAAAIMLLAILVPRAAMATQNDRSQPIQVSSQYGDVLAKPNGVSHLKGNVVISQGTMKITGDDGLIYFDANSQIRRVVLTGSVHLQQVDNNGNLLKARADRIVYDIQNGIATLTGNAHVDQVGRGSASGDTLVYNTTTSAMTGSSHGDHRVHMTFLPRQKATGKPASAASTTSKGGH